MTDSINNSYHETRARQSLGISNEVIYESVRRVLEQEGVSGGVLLDVGCGGGHLLPFVADLVDRYVGTDIVRYDGFPGDAEFHSTDLESGRLGVDDSSMDTIVAVEVIEHLENPWAFVRELARAVRPGGVGVVTTLA